MIVTIVALAVATASTVIFAAFDARYFGGREQITRIATWAAIWYTVAAVAIIGF